MVMIFFSEAGVGLSVGETAHAAENNRAMLNKIFFMLLGMLETRGLLGHLLIIRNYNLHFHLRILLNEAAIKP